MKLVPEAQAFRGRGAAFVVGAAVGSGSSSSSATAAQQQATAQQQQATAAQQQAVAAQQQASAPGASVPLGTVVATLPAGCTPTPVGGVNYYNCGGNFYQAVFEGSTLKYITTKPK
jgi:type II secretory pathway pseudopilin PulG